MQPDVLTLFILAVPGKSSGTLNLLRMSFIHRKGLP
jgi:hypothetical protein